MRKSNLDRVKFEILYSNRDIECDICLDMFLSANHLCLITENNISDYSYYHYCNKCSKRLEDSLYKISKNNIDIERLDDCCSFCNSKKYLSIEAAKLEKNRSLRSVNSEHRLFYHRQFITNNSIENIYYIHVCTQCSRKLLSNIKITRLKNILL